MATISLNKKQKKELDRRLDLHEKRLSKNIPWRKSISAIRKKIKKREMFGNPILFSILLMFIHIYSIGQGKDSVLTNEDSVAFQKGKFIFCFGYGFPNMDLQKNSSNNYNNTKDHITQLGPIHAKFEYGINNKTGFVLSINYSNFNVAGHNNYSPNFPNIYTGYSLSVISRMNFHLGNYKYFDPFFGIGFGYRLLRYKEDNLYSTSYASVTPFDIGMPIGFEATMGMRYYIAGTGLGIYAEMGISKSIIQTGIVVKF